jgi:hypothetical protein
MSKAWNARTDTAARPRSDSSSGINLSFFPIRSRLAWSTTNRTYEEAKFVLLRRANQWFMRRLEQLVGVSAC